MTRQNKNDPDCAEPKSTSWLRNFVARFLFPYPRPNYSVDSHKGELMWIPRDKSVRKKLMRAEVDNCYSEAFLTIPQEKLHDSIPCLWLPFTHSRFILFFLHGNAEDIGKCRAFLDHCRIAFQCHVIAVEYPGYGICPGEPSEPAFFKNVETVFEFVEHELNWPQDSILVMGRSIGTGPACKLAQKRNLGGLILVSPMKSIKDVVKESVGFIANFVIDDNFHNLKRMEDITCKTMIIHGKKDTLIPLSHGQAIFNACKAEKRLVAPDEFEHNTNLLAKNDYFIHPMLEFFPLPDYWYEDYKLPKYIFDKRLCAHHDTGYLLPPSHADMKQYEEKFLKPLQPNWQKKDGSSFLSARQPTKDTPPDSPPTPMIFGRRSTSRARSHKKSPGKASEESFVSPEHYAGAQTRMAERDFGVFVSNSPAPRLPTENKSVSLSDSLPSSPSPQAHFHNRPSNQSRPSFPSSSYLTPPERLPILSQSHLTPPSNKYYDAHSNNNLHGLYKDNTSPLQSPYLPRNSPIRPVSQSPSSSLFVSPAPIRLDQSLSPSPYHTNTNATREGSLPVLPVPAIGRNNTYDDIPEEGVQGPISVSIILVREI